MKVATDSCLFGAWVANKIETENLKIKTCLDIGSGSGLLSFMLAQKCDAEIEAIEIDEEALAQALENKDLCSFRNRIRFIHADIRDHLFEKKYDIIISNPPFYENELKSFSSKKNTAHHGDKLSLRELVSVIQKNLSPNGFFFLLLPFKRDTEIRKLIHETGLHLNEVMLVRQSVKHDYFRIMLKGGTSAINISLTEFDELSIRDERDAYTEEFIELLRDYYLHF
jgi:tRNA1Val (adenine37-N6)-methyltransferase